MANQYCVEYEGKMYGPFATNTGGGTSSTDARNFANTNCTGAPVMTLWDPTVTFQPPFPPSQASG